MKFKYNDLAAAAFIILASQVSVAHATTVDFNTLGGGTSSTFTTYTEGGFTVASTSGTWQVAKLFGNPVPDVSSSGSAALAVTYTGGNFTFSDVDLANASSFRQDVTNYSIEGYLGNVLEFTQLGQVFGGEGNTFVTIASTNSTQAIDLLVISESAENASNLDNIVLFASAVPEPSTWAMMILGFAGIGFTAYRRKSNPASMAV
jgi:hypothetical protein